jgi:fructokinase
MQHIYTVGETILDIIFREGQPVAARPGGSSFNASISLGRLGAPVTFISEMGNDKVGDMIEAFLQENGVNSELVARYSEGQSAIALAFLNEKSDAEYQFYKDYPHQRLEIRFPDFASDDLLLFGSFYALNPGIRPRVKALLDKASRAGALLIYDPNFRNTHLDKKEELIPVITENMSFASVVRASDEDLEHIFGAADPRDAWEAVRKYCSTLVYTANAHGVHLLNDHMDLHLEVERINPVSTIGAGDTFNAGLIYGIWKKGYSREEIGRLGRKHWEDLIRCAISFSREVCMSYDNYLPREYTETIRAMEE